MGWCWASTEESVANDEISVLAVVETLLAAVGLFVLVAALDSAFPLFIWSCCGWLLLLRTGYSEMILRIIMAHTLISSEHAIQKAKETDEEHKLNPHKEQPNSDLTLKVGFLPELGLSRKESAEGLMVLKFTVLAIPLRIYATLVAFLKRPWTSLKAIPDNFLRAVACIDLAAPVRLMPLPQKSELQSTSTVLANINHTRLIDLFPFDVGVWERLISRASQLVVMLFVGIVLFVFYERSLRMLPGLQSSSQISWFRWVVYLVVCVSGLSYLITLLLAARMFTLNSMTDPPFSAIKCFPAIFYRLTLKATVLIYSPLLVGIYLASSRRDARAMLAPSQWLRLRVRFSWVIVGLFVSKVAFFSFGLKLEEQLALLKPS